MAISRVCTVGNCWKSAKFTMGPYEQNQHFAELRQKVCVHTRGSATNRFVKFGRQKRTFSGEKRKKRLAESSQSDSSLAITFATFL